MTDDLEAQARRLKCTHFAAFYGGGACAECVAAWARRLVAESRAGAQARAGKEEA